MIKVTVQYNDHLVDIHFPCSETTLRSALMEIHAADDNPPELFVTDVIFPEELDHLKDCILKKTRHNQWLLLDERLLLDMLLYHLKRYP